MERSHLIDVSPGKSSTEPGRQVAGKPLDKRFAIVRPVLTAALVVAQWPGIAALRRAQVACAAGLGPLGFGLLRAMMGGIYSETQIWFGFWEEMTELLLVVGICFLLWTFRAQLLPAWSQLLSQVTRRE